MNVNNLLGKKYLRVFNSYLSLTVILFEVKFYKNNEGVPITSLFLSSSQDFV